MSGPRLDPSVFNPELYAHVYSFWFLDLPADATVATEAVAKRWFGLNSSKEDAAAFDEQCCTNFKSALDSIGPSKLSLPAFVSYEVDREHRSDIAAPFLAEIPSDTENGPKTALSLILLLDQLTRNIYRSRQDLIFSHFDRIALAFSLCLTDPAGKYRTDQNPMFHLKPVYSMWFSMPKMHSEYLPYHSEVEKGVDDTMPILKESGDQDAFKYLERMKEFSQMHSSILEQFGRYPYRNGFIGRKWTVAERDWLKAGGKTFGVKVDPDTIEVE